MEIKVIDGRFSVNYENKPPTEAELWWLAQALLAWEAGKELPEKPKETDNPSNVSTVVRK